MVNPCKYKYDYVLKLENIYEESKWLFQKLNITEINYPAQYSNPTDKTRVNNYIKGESEK